MSTGFQRGHKIAFIDGTWLYEDTRTSILFERPCVRCGKMPTQEGYDACLGYINGAKSTCCGHGKTEPILIWEGGIGEEAQVSKPNHLLMKLIIQKYQAENLQKYLE